MYFKTFYKSVTKGQPFKLLKWTKDMKRHHKGKYRKGKQMKKSSKPLVQKEMQIKIATRYH